MVVVNTTHQTHVFMHIIAVRDEREELWCKNNSRGVPMLKGGEIGESCDL